jgi:(1->4)-alpha-D-glucan 1-alpha-D-glucosylmutase
MRWSKLNRSKRRKLDGERAPSRNDEYLLYQTLLGVWPFETPDAAGLAQLSERIEAYLLKAVREAKQHSSWINPDGEYEAATRAFIRALLSPEPSNLFLRDFLPFQQRIARVGAFSSLAQLLLKLASPGVPDIYQGNEVWDFSLVDPDNRRPVDYALRRSALAEIRQQLAEQGAAECATSLLESFSNGRIKLYLTWKTLAFRREAESLFRDSDYLPLKVQGEQAERVCAFARHFGGETLLVVVPRLLDGLMGEPGRLPVGEAVWGDSWLELPPERLHAQWINVLTEESVSTQQSAAGSGLALARLFRAFPYGLLRADQRAPD